MSKFNDQTVFAAFQPYLQSEEFLGNAAYCVYQPPQALGCLFFLIGLLPGLLYNALLSKFYVVGLTNHNFIVLRLASRFGGNIAVAEVFAYSLDQLPETRATFGSFGTALKINDPVKPFKVGFPMVGVPDNYNRGRMIATTLLSRWQQRQFPSGELAFQSQAIPGPALLPGSVPAGSASIAGRAQFSPQMRPMTYVPQSSHKALGCFGAAMITVGAGIFLFCALGFLGFLLDEKKTSQDVTAGLIGISVLLLFSATLLTIGIYLIVRGRKEKAAAMSLQRTQANMSFTGQMPRRFTESQPVTGQTETNQTITLWARDQQTADSLSNDQYFLYGALMADNTPEVKQFFDAWGQRESLSYVILPNAAKGGYDVKITLPGAGPLSHERR